MRGRKRDAPSMVFVKRGMPSVRLIVNRAQGYVCRMTPDACTITKFSDLKHITPHLIEYAAVMHWGYVVEEPDTKARSA